ncbi:MAG: hypothetical protein JXR94_19700, partial [Candidatus Hydrogenedentes bacterium]|nr:hypothetical protein [Candidatus Hydrogenedentota bacterium]
AGGDAMRLDLDRKVAGVTVQVCYWPSPLLAEEMRREPYLFYMLTYGHVLADPGGLAAEHQAAGRRYFDEHPRVTALWESQIEEVRHVRLAGCYEGGTFHKSPDTYPNHLWWAQFAEYLRERVRRMDDGRQ